MDLAIKDKVALVTGGSHGIGLAIARSLAEEGCYVAICSRSRENLDLAVSEINTEGAERVMAVQADVLDPSDISRVVRAVTEKWGTVHILVNNVGGGGRWGLDSVDETPEQVWYDVYNKNAMAAVRFTCSFLPYMRKQKWGRVVTISSTCGLEDRGARVWFNMAKSAEITLMKTLARDHKQARFGITFNTVAPGAIMIPGTGWEKERDTDPEKFLEKLDNAYPLGRLGTPEEVAYAVLMLCSPRASLINGACIVVDGGETRMFS